MSPLLSTVPVTATSKLSRPSIHAQRCPPSARRACTRHLPIYTVARDKTIYAKSEFDTTAWSPCHLHLNAGVLPRRAVHRSFTSVEVFLQRPHDGRRRAPGHTTRGRPTAFSLRALAFLAAEGTG